MTGAPLRLAALLALLAASPAAASSQWGGSYPYPVPLGLQPPPVPDADPVTGAKVALGKTLFFDKRLSRDSTIACATCHDPQKGWTDQSPVSTGIGGQKGTRSAPTVLNAAYMTRQFWDGRAASLEEQSLAPIENPVEMGFTHAGVVRRLSGIAGYAPLFKDAFGDDRVTIERVAMAIASFERTVLSGNSPYDRWKAGDKGAMSPAAIRGYALFEDPKRANCAACHSGPDFSDSKFHNLGVGAGGTDEGRAAVTHDPADAYAFKTPTLRDLADTAPYMHDGSKKTLAEVVDFYDDGGIKNPHRDPKIKPIGLSDAEQADLVAFLGALNGDPVRISAPPMPQ
ncbi:MAG: c-type cytochrome [Elusimicrobia bacterium]|nr:c-type cytochrome [Elusimicrobiota bacterium]